MTPPAFRLAALTVLALCLMTPTTWGRNFQSADETAIRTLVERYFAAYAKKDLEAMVQMWSDKSPDLATAKVRMKETFRISDQIEMKNLRFRQLKIEDDHATVLVTLDASAIDTTTKRPRDGLGKQSQALTFERAGGEWRISSYSSAEEELAGRLVAAKSETEREALLAEDTELLTPTLARSINRIGERFRMQLDFDQAMRSYQLMKSVAERIGDKYTLAASLNFIGMVLVLQGDYEGGIESMTRSVQVREEMGRRDLLTIPLGIMGHAYDQQGNNIKALEIAYKQLAIAEEFGDKTGAAHANYDIGLFHRSQYSLDLALEYLKKSVKAGEELGETALVAESLESIAGTYSLAGDYHAAIDAENKALAVMGNPTSGISAALMFRSIGDVHLAHGSYSLALEQHLKSLHTIEASGVKYSVVITLTSIAIDYYSLRDYEKAIEYAERAAKLARESDLLESLSQSRSYAGLAYRALGRTEEARRAFEEAIATNETMRAQVGGGEQERQRFFEAKTLPYYAMVELLAADNKYEQALVYAEQAKGRVLLDVIRSGRASINKPMSAEEREREKRLSMQAVSLNTRIQAESARPQSSPARLIELKKSLDQARLDQKAFQAKLYSEHPDLRVSRGDAPPLTMEQANELLPDSKTALIEYAVAEDRTFLFVLTESPQRGREKPVLKLYDLKISRKDLVERVLMLNQRIANNDLEYGGPAGDLYNLLIAPARQQLQARTRLIIVPDDILWETPFQALRSPEGRFLIQSTAISYAPSLAVLREFVKSRKLGSAGTLFAMANPKLEAEVISRSKNVLMGASFEPLPEGERLVKDLRQIYGAKSSKVYVGAEAREEVFKAEAGKYRILQLATHGVINNASPMYSHVVLAQSDNAKEDGLLEAWEIMKMDLQADLAVLSACETARGRIGPGEGIIGLTWALFVAGCPTTVVSQWKVESSSTAELMLAFHRNLQAGATKSEALRQASIKLMSDKKYNHPFYWAGFIVVGDGG
jgi:CHAT domain-containing protein/tetratricopeptide (TPR) repeat protein